VLELGRQLRRPTGQPASQPVKQHDQLTSHQGPPR
jgi:hypothetical protein